MDKRNYIIKNGKLVFSESVIEADLLIEDGIFSEIIKKGKNKLDQINQNNYKTIKYFNFS